MLRDAAVEGTSAVVTCSYLQIYNDKLYDLLVDRCDVPHGGAARSAVTVTVGVDQEEQEAADASGDGANEETRGVRRRSLRVSVCVRPCTWRQCMRLPRHPVLMYVASVCVVCARVCACAWRCRVGNAEDVMVLLQIGGRNRALRGTEANEASSRSHALLQLNIEVEINQEGGSTVIRRAKLNLVGPRTATRAWHSGATSVTCCRAATQVDLAGSEKWSKRSDMEKTHVAELVHINKVGVRTSVTATVTAVHDWHRTPCR